MQAMADGRRGRWTTTTGREENIAAAMNNSEKVRWLSVCLSFCLPHAGYGGGTKTRLIVATTTGRKDNIADVGYTTCLLLFFGCYLFVVSHMLRRDKDKEDGGDDNETRGQHRRRRYVGYTTCRCFFGCYLFVVSHMLANGGGTTTRRMMT